MDAIAVPRSWASKLTADPRGRPVAATHASQASCPPDCPLMGHGCFAEYGKQLWHTRRLNAATPRKSTPSAIAAREARALDVLHVHAGAPLRLHVVGDCRTPRAARILADSAARYRARGGGPVFTFTHGYKRVARADWGTVSVLASVHTVRQAKVATRKGYAVAITTPSFAEGQRRAKAAGLRGVPCPAQTTGTDCERCRLCMRADTLHRVGTAILFDPHGAGKAKAREAVR